ncbi:MAG: hypothetical protein QOH06_3937 [Acidobacteriota bacterium]|nr:hypothetical protein [Acidobacteriota bacterium]
MRSMPAPSPALGGEDAARRAPERGRAFSRRIECDGEGYSAGPRGPARGGGMREPGSRQARRDDLHG